MARLTPNGDPLFRHDAEGPDDMPVHVRSILTQVSPHIPIDEARLMLGVWQGIYIWEHRRAPHAWEVGVTLVEH